MQKSTAAWQVDLRADEVVAVGEGDNTTADTRPESVAQTISLCTVATAVWV